MELEEYLASKPLYYKEIDYTRMSRAWESVKSRFTLGKIIHIIGTNGKGSTGRFLAHFLYKNGFHTGHYTSPHILRFNERIWLDGHDADDTMLEKHHQKLYLLLNEEFKETLSYFEYTTLLAVSCMEKCDYIVMEAGLGGEHDATAVFDKVLTLVTPIGKDHESFLGTTLEEIGRTKLNAVQNTAILSDQCDEVLHVAEVLKTEKKLSIFSYNDWITEKENEIIENFTKENDFAHYQAQNLKLAMAGAKYLGFSVKLNAIKDIYLFGRCQKLFNNVTIDVGHNALAALVLKKNFRKKKVILVYNTFRDKNYKEILTILKPVIKEVQIIPIFSQRAETTTELEAALKHLSIDFSYFSQLRDDEEYLVFGSFSTVEAFLKAVNEE